MDRDQGHSNLPCFAPALPGSIQFPPPYVLVPSSAARGQREEADTLAVWIHPIY